MIAGNVNSKGVSLNVSLCQGQQVNTARLLRCRLKASFRRRWPLSWSSITRLDLLQLKLLINCRKKLV